MVRKYQPDIVINPRSGMAGDFQTNEGSKPVTGKILNFPWEKCLSLNPPAWGYNKVQQLMSLKEIIDMLVNTVDRGGNMCLNVGPDPDGVIPLTHVQRLKEVGQWLKKNGESIYGTRPGPFEPVDNYYGSTHKGDKIYIHLVANPGRDTTLQLPTINKAIKSCRILRGDKLSFTQDQNGITLKIEANKLDPVVTTVVIDTR
jgi:alpha-L-fucosidase